MQVRYHSLFKFVFTHDYFPQSQGAVFEVMPTQETARIMKNHKILLHGSGYSFELFMGVQGLDEAATISVEGIPPLNFFINCNDLYFLNYTSWPESAQNQLFFLANTQDQSSFTEFDFYPAAGRVVQPYLKQGSNTVIFQDFSGSIIKKLEIQRDGDGEVPISVDDLPSEMFHWDVNDEVQPSFIHVGSEIDEKTIGLLQFDLQYWNDTPPDNQQYEFQFTARQAYWAFKVVLPSSRFPDLTNQDIKIKLPKALLEHTSLQGHEEVLFNGPTDDAIMGNQPVKVLLSPIPLKLQQVAQHFCELELFTEDHPNHVQITLPNPSPELVQKFTPDGGSDSFLVTHIIYV